VPLTKRPARQSVSLFCLFWLFGPVLSSSSVGRRLRQMTRIRPSQLFICCSNGRARFVQNATADPFAREWNAECHSHPPTRLMTPRPPLQSNDTCTPLIDKCDVNCKQSRSLCPCSPAAPKAPVSQAEYFSCLLFSPLLMVHTILDEI
jgi:hypothetical protein